MRLSRIGIGIAAAAITTVAGLTPAFANTRTVTVTAGSSLWKIARAHGVSPQALERANPSVNPHNLQIGSKVVLPSTKTTKTASSNLYWMEHIINAEAGGQSLEAQVAVGDVILHRLHSGKYGSTVKQVVFQVSDGHYQFTPALNGYIHTKPNASSIKAAKLAMSGRDDEVPGAFVFYTPAKTPSGSWVWSQPKISRIDNLVFAK